jgi:DeoR/GlpR family transcriptional regulator of sugar metabolism
MKINNKETAFDEDELNKKLLELVKKSRVVTTSEIATEFNISWNTAEKYLLELALEGKVERMKKAGVNLWVAK